MKKEIVENASRAELFIRIPYFIGFYILAYILMLVIGIWGMWVGIMFLLNWFYILITGKRAQFMHEQINKWYIFAYQRVYVEWIYQKCLPYFLLLTDKRPGFSI